MQNMVPEWLQVGKHVQLYRGWEDDIHMMACGHVRGVYALGVAVQECDSDEPENFYLWSAIEQIRPVE